MPCVAACLTNRKQTFMLPIATALGSGNDALTAAPTTMHPSRESGSGQLRTDRNLAVQAAWRTAGCPGTHFIKRIE